VLPTSVIIVSGFIKFLTFLKTFFISKIGNAKIIKSTSNREVSYLLLALSINFSFNAFFKILIFSSIA